MASKSALPTHLCIYTLSSIYKYVDESTYVCNAPPRVKSLGGHFACLCRRFEFYEVKKKFFLLFFKKKMEILLHFLSFL